MNNSSTMRGIGVALALLSSACRTPNIEQVHQPTPWLAPPTDQAVGSDEFGGIGGPLTGARPPLSFVLNVPAYRLDAFLHDSLVRSFRVSVGMPKYPTPLGSFFIRVIEWNPWWTPPESEWAAKEKTTPPGPDNPMGRVKLYMRPLYFLHGTPFEGSIGSAASHGCVRLRNDDAIELAKLVHRFGTPSLSESQVDNLAQDLVHTRRVTIERPIPITVRYDRIEVRQNQVVVYPDIYHRGSPLTVEVVLAALERAGFRESRVDEDQVRALVRRSQQGRASMPIDSILISPSRN
jgi:L,D-transpeptidase-like protein